MMTCYCVAAAAVVVVVVDIVVVVDVVVLVCCVVVLSPSLGPGGHPVEGVALGVAVVKPSEAVDLLPGGGDIDDGVGHVDEALPAVHRRIDGRRHNRVFLSYPLRPEDL